MSTSKKKVEKIKDLELTLELKEEHKEVFSEIRGLINTSALAKIQIGELLIKHTEKLKKGYKIAYYAEVGLSSRTAQRYKDIASNPEVQKLKAENKLDGLNMSRILELIGCRINVRGINNDNAPVKKYKPLGYGAFDYKKCRSTASFKIEYELLDERVHQLEAELDLLKSKAS